MRKGFALLEILIAVVIIAAIFGSGLYLKNLQNGAAAELAAKEAMQAVASNTAAQENLLNEAEGLALANASATATAAVTTSTAPATAPAATGAAVTSTPTDPLAGLGSNMYASGNLPLGDGKYVTTAPKKGYIYLCNVNGSAQGASMGGAMTDGPWIGATTWNVNEKIHVEGSVMWPDASYSMTINGSTRNITTNDLPSNIAGADGVAGVAAITTGNFPIAASDPAYQYDTNPNSIKAQSLSFSFPAAPVAAATPSCIGGEVGVMTDGVVLFDGFDAELRDAAAHELQDSCDGHPQESGEYHYHGPSSCLPNGSTTVIGYAFDGFPITGGKIATNRYLTTADLDECHGITSPIMLDGKMTTMYHYVMTEDFPYSVSCFRGTSTVHGPTAPTSSGGTGNTADTTPPTPPAQATAACSGKLSGNNCSFSGQNGGTISGICQTPPAQSSLACVPAGQ